MASVRRPTEPGDTAADRHGFNNDTAGNSGKNPAAGDNAGQNGLVIRLNPPPRTYRAVAGRKFAWHGDYWRTLTPRRAFIGETVDLTLTVEVS